MTSTSEPGVIDHKLVALSYLYLDKSVSYTLSSTVFQHFTKKYCQNLKIYNIFHKIIMFFENVCTFYFLMYKHGADQRTYRKKMSRKPLKKYQVITIICFLPQTMCTYMRHKDIFIELHTFIRPNTGLWLNILMCSCNLGTVYL